MAYLWSHGFTAKQTVHELQVSNSTVSFFNNLFRRVCAKEYPPSGKIGGFGVFVKIDESHLFTRKYHVGRVLKRQQFWIFGGIDESGRIFLEEVENRDSDTLMEILVNRVELGVHHTE